MKIKKITKDEAQRLTKGIQWKAIFSRETVWTTNEEREKPEYLDNWTAKGKPCALVPAFIVDDRFLCLWDTGYGKDIVVDLKGKGRKKKQVYWATRGVFEKEFVFLSDYYSYPDGAFFYRVNE